MRDLQDYIVEGIFDIDNNINNIDKNIDKNFKDQIKQFLKDNFIGHSKCKISKTPNIDGKYEVSCKGDVEVKYKNKITSLTNGMFIWTKVDGTFYCWWCKSLMSLEGAPKEVGGSFHCERCDLLTSLEGAPEKIDGDFNCRNCKSLTSLEGAPKEVGGFFSCDDCGVLFSEKDVNKVSNVKGKIYVE